MILYYSGTGNSWMIANRGEWMGEIPVSKNLCRKKGWKFMGFNFLVMSQCNIMMHKMLSPEENENIIREAMPKVEQIAELISLLSREVQVLNFWNRRAGEIINLHRTR